MKVFTIGLDQKLSPAKDEDTLSTSSTEKNGPPPSYISTSSQVPCQYAQPAIIVQRKSRGYKGVLLVMLTVFLIAVFALTISELAYNRQRDETFFKLRWAELKHRMGMNHGNDPHFSGLARKAISQEDIQPIKPMASIMSPQMPKKADEVPPITKQTEISQNLDDSSKPSSSIEVEPSGLLSNENLRDARLQFLRKILQKIRKNAEQMGFDGTMQISVIEVEPQDEGDSSRSSAERQQQQNVLPSHPPFFIQPFNGPSQPRPWIEISRMDSFGEPPMNQLFEPQNNEVQERPRPRLPNLWQPMLFNNLNNNPWQRAEFPRPSLVPPQSIEGSALPRPGPWNPNFSPQNHQQNVGNERGEVYGRRFGDLLRDIIANRIQTFQHFANPITFVNPQSQQPQQQNSIPQQQQQPQQTVPFNFQPFPQQKQAERPQTVGIDFQNDFFPPIPNQQQNGGEDKKSSVEIPKPKEVSGEISSETSKNADIPSGFIKPNPVKIPEEQAETPKPNDAIQIAPMIGNTDESSKENEKDKPIDFWPTPIKSEEPPKVQIQDDQNKENETPAQGQHQNPARFFQESFPNSAPLFFQVDDPNQAQQQQSSLTTA